MEKRPTTEREKQAERNLFEGTKLQGYFEKTGPTQWTLSEMTESICHDVGIYFAEVFIHNNSRLKWGQNIRSKTSIDHNYPVVQGFYGADFNPLTPIRVSALEILEGKKSINWMELYQHYYQYIHN